MSVWYAIPSKKPRVAAQECIDRWRTLGYRVAIWRDSGDEPVDCDLMIGGAYRGYAPAVNALCREILSRDPGAEWIVTGGDDIDPDPNHTAEQIGHECGRHFGQRQQIYRMEPVLSDHGWSEARMQWSTFGVMQPTGDRWANGSIDRICGSPWMGAEFCRRMYGGNGPLWDGWFHCFVDEELQNVAIRLGCFWQRRDLTHFHHHWARGEGRREVDFSRPEPHYLKDKNATLNRDRPLFERRQRQGFPGHEPLPA